MIKKIYWAARIVAYLACFIGIFLYLYHQADADPLVDVGRKDLTAHVDFTAVALAGQDAGLEVLGYTSQARFLFNCGLLADLEGADLRERAPERERVLVCRNRDTLRHLNAACMAGGRADGERRRRGSACCR